MLSLNPMGGAMLMKSIGLFLQSGRRASQPQAHALVRQSSVKPAVAPSPSRPEELVPQLRAAKNKPRTPPKPPKPESTKKDKKKKKMEEKKKPSTALGSKSTPKMIENLKKRTHFSRLEIESLIKVYHKLVASAANNLSKNAASSAVPTPGMPPSTNRVEGLDRVVFRELIHNTFDLVTEEVLIDRIFCAFDRNNDGVVKLDNWVCGLSTFLRGNPEERTAFCFLVYDLNGDGFITREEMMHLLRNCLMKSPQEEDPEEGVRDLVELALRKLDIDKDGKISYQDFLQAVTEEPLLLEAFGQCLPNDAACQTFLSTLHS